MLQRTHTGALAAVIAAIAITGGTYGIVSETTGTSSAATSGQVVPLGGGGSNARSGPAAGGSVGTVASISTSGFTLTTSGGQKVTVEKGSAKTPSVKKGERVLVLGTTDGTTITASQVVVQPTSASAPATAATVVPFTRGAPSTAKQAGQIPANYTEGSGTIVGGTSASKATKAALTAYPGGIVDRVAKLSNGEYEVHNIGVNWPHHVFVNQSFKVTGAD